MCFAWLQRVMLVLVVLWPLMSHAQDYTFTLVTLPFAGVQDVSVAAKIPGAPAALVGNYRDAAGRDEGFVQQGPHTIPLLRVVPQAANASLSIAGSEVDTDAAMRYADGSLYTHRTPRCLHLALCDQITAGRSLSTTAWGINASGVVAGSFTVGDSHIRAYRFDPSAPLGSRFALILPPFPHTDALALGINDAGKIVGVYLDATGGHGFLLDGTTYTSFDAPGASYTEPSGINNSGAVAGIADNQSFVYDGTTFTLVAHPTATNTLVRCITDEGQLCGHIVQPDHTIHGFVATPVTAKPRPPHQKKTESDPPRGRMATAEPVTCAQHPWNFRCMTLPRPQP